MKLPLKTIVFAILTTGMIVYLSPEAIRASGKQNPTSFSVSVNPGMQNPVCKDCHADKLSHTNMHAIVEMGCENCHQSNGKKHPEARVKGFELIEKVPELCYVCHESKTSKTYVHLKLGNDGCSVCHDPHGSEYESLITRTSPTGICMSCHKISPEKNESLHAPLEFASCFDCHDAHQSDYAALLKTEKTTLCAQCHDGFADMDGKNWTHASVSDNCANCHNAHKSKYAKLLIQKPEELCFQCHENPTGDSKNTVSVHAPLKTEGSCTSCHNPHYSDNAFGLSETGAEFCFSCHNKSLKSEDRTIANMKSLIQDNPFKHSALTFGSCETCHLPHASSHNKLLTESYPPDLYSGGTAEDFQLCFSCHNSEMITTEYSDELTNFRHGNHNMHYVHVSKGKGRSCSICHDAHAGKNKYLIKEYSYYGNWEMPMGFRFDSQGGSCATGCHAEKLYDRNARLIANSEEGKEIESPTVEEEILADDSVAVALHDDKNELELPDSNSENNHESVNETAELVDKQNDTQAKDSVDHADETDIEAEPDYWEELTRAADRKIYFDFDSYGIRPSGILKIQKLAELMLKEPQAKLKIKAYTDNIGKEDYNIELAKKRAFEVRNFLYGKGINKNRCMLEIHGEKMPAADNSTSEGRARNRRVSFDVFKDK